MADTPEMVRESLSKLSRLERKRKLPLVAAFRAALTKEQHENA